MNILSVLHCEVRKIIRSNVFWIMFLVLGFGPIMMGVGNVLSSAAGGVSWEQYLTGLLDTLAPLGLIGYTFVAAWVFGREFADRTIKDLLAKPVSRAKNCIVQIPCHFSMVPVAYRLYVCRRFCRRGNHGRPRRVHLLHFGLVL
ncbi:ABC transporter permease [Paenibacillus rhizoplanae]